MNGTRRVSIVRACCSSQAPGKKPPRSDGWKPIKSWDKPPIQWVQDFWTSTVCMIYALTWFSPVFWWLRVGWVFVGIWDGENYQPDRLMVLCLMCNVSVIIHSIRLNGPLKRLVSRSPFQWKNKPVLVVENQWFPKWWIFHIYVKVFPRVHCDMCSPTDSMSGLPSGIQWLPWEIPCKQRYRTTSSVHDNGCLSGAMLLEGSSMT